MDAVARWRWPLLLTLTALLAGASLSAGVCDGDGQMFANLGRQLLTGHLSAVYAQSGNQAGPFELMFNVLATAWSPNCAYTGWELPGAVSVAMLTVTVLLFMVRRVMRGTDAVLRARVELSAGVLLLATVAPTTAKWGHPADVVIPLSWMTSAVLARRGRWMLAGVVLGFAGGWETWAVLGIPVLLLSGRRAIPAGVVAAAAAAGCYLPFVATGRFAMFSMRWTVFPHSWMAFAGLHHVSWPLRMAQTLLVLTACAVGVWLLRRSPHVIWAAPVGAAVVRMLTDPGLWPYYWAIPAVPAVAGVAALLTVPPAQRSARWCGLGACAVPLAPHPGLPWAYAQLGVAAGLLAAFVVTSRRRGTNCAAR